MDIYFYNTDYVYRGESNPAWSSGFMSTYLEQLGDVPEWYPYQFQDARESRYWAYVERQTDKVATWFAAHDTHDFYFVQVDPTSPMAKQWDDYSDYIANGGWSVE